MSDTTAPNVQSAATQPVQSLTFVQAPGQSRVGHLLAGLRESAPAADESVDSDDARFENQLALVRLGMATSLFYALRTKHSPTAAHCLRVALNCSAWAERLGLDEPARDRIEVAALLHDLGKIGIPDRILRKPGKLSVDEQLTMDGCAQLGCDILQGCTDDSQLLDTVLYANSWYDSRRDGEGPRGDALPLGSRMIAIADAFDAMTTDTVHRPAMSRERAIQELIDGSCTKFDPELAVDFNRMLEQRPEMLQGVIVDRWLQQLQGNSGDALGTSVNAVGQNHGEQVRRESLFFRQLIGNMKDGVVFTDPEGTITQWNTVMHRLTGIASDAIVGQNWTSECLRLRERNAVRTGESCLVRDCLATGSMIARPMMIEQPGADPTPVHVQVTPVVDSTPGIHGTVILIRDLSDQTSLEAQLVSLHHQTTRDALTGVANRAYFDEALRELTESAAAGGSPFSLIICDIDHFKRVNDVHGHPAGDDALISFASILTSHSRDDDLVARYGGEEFLLLASKCDNATAARRAETIRQALEKTPLSSIGGQSVTASFGVTGFQSGDSAETVLSRADRALLKAKDNGRNRVIQLGSGNQTSFTQPHAKRGWFSWFHSNEQPREQEFDVITPVPIDLAIEKLRGFIADHKAEIINVNENQLSLKLRALCSAGGRRRADHHIALRVQLTLSEAREDASEARSPCKTNVHISLQPIRNRDRRGSELSTCFGQVLSSLRSYLMGEIQRPDRR